MNNAHSVSTNDKNSSFVMRVLDNDALKTGAAAGVAGILIAIVTEAIWPSGR